MRGVLVLPNGTGKTKKVLVIAKGERADAATAAGADIVGAEELIQKIQSENWFDFDVMITTPDMMGVVGRIGRLLGPKGLMPNPKSGTVTMDVAKAANKTEIKTAVEKLFGVQVESVNTVNCKGKLKRMGRNAGYTPDYKKAIVQLKADSKAIEFFASLS